MPNILIYTQNDDPHTESITKYIQQLSGNPICFMRFEAENYLTFDISKLTPTIKINQNIYPLNSSTFKGVLWRPKPASAGESPGMNGSVAEKLRASEWRHAADAIQYFLSESKWVNSRQSTLKMNNKIIQLRLARELDLLTPDTIITNNYNDALGISQKTMIYKTLSSFITEDSAIFTNKIDKDDLKKNGDSISLAPGIFQPLIEKKHELRVIVVGDKIFSIKVNSQAHEKTKIDWRHDQSENIFEQGDLSDNTSKKLLMFNKKAELVYGVYDFIVDRNGNEIFLECNPNGQWLFVGDDLGQPISKAIAEELLNKL